MLTSSCSSDDSAARDSVESHDVSLQKPITSRCVSERHYTCSSPPDVLNFDSTRLQTVSGRISCLEICDSPEQHGPPSRLLYLHCLNTSIRIETVPSICSPPSLQTVDQLTILNATLLAESISPFPCQRASSRSAMRAVNVVLGQWTLLGFAASRDDGALPAVNDLPQALVIVRGYFPCAPKRCRISSAVSKS